MPVVRYFLFVGVALLALLFGIDVYLPKLPSAEIPGATTDLSVIRIRSDHKWPERVVFDTSLPTITHPLTPMRVVTIPYHRQISGRPWDLCGRQLRQMGACSRGVGESAAARSPCAGPAP